MSLNVVWKVIVMATLLLIIQIVAHKYVITVTDEKIFSPCDKPNTNFIDKYFDLSNIQFQYLENGSVYLSGESVLIQDMGTKDNPTSIQIFRKNRDSWISTVYNMNRDDVCKHLYDETELWFTYVKDIPEQERTCPFVKGNKFYFDAVSDMELDLVDPRLAGEYKIQILVSIAELNEMLCANIMAEVYKK